MRLILASEFPASFETVKYLLGDVSGRRGVFVPTAAYGEGWEPDLNVSVEPLKSLGVEMRSFDLRGKSEQETARALSDIDIIYVGGGNTFFLLECMQKCGFEQVLRDRLESSAVYIGSSAGSVVCGPDIAHIHIMDDPDAATLSDTRGLSLIDCLYVPHLDNAAQGQRAWQTIEWYKGQCPLIALYDRQVLYVENKVMQILG